MAEDSILPVLLLGGAAYLAWQYLQGTPAASPATASPAGAPAPSSWTDPETGFIPNITSAVNKTAGITVPSSYSPTPPQSSPQSVAPPPQQAPPQANFAPPAYAASQPGPNPYFNAGQSAQPAANAWTQTPAQAAAQAAAIAAGPVAAQHYGAQPDPNSPTGWTYNGQPWTPGVSTTATSFAAGAVKTVYCGPGCYNYYDASGNLVGSIGGPGASAGSLLAQVAGS